MPLSIDDVTISPHPVPASGGLVRAACRITADAPVKSVTAYPPMGDPISFAEQAEGEYVAIEYVAPGMMPGTYDVTLRVTDEAGNTAVRSVPVTLE